jgi:hypothetical protein
MIRLVMNMLADHGKSSARRHCGPNTPRPTDAMKKMTIESKATQDAYTMRKEYDFSGGVRGATAARYRKGSDLVVADTDMLDVFLTPNPSTRRFGRSQSDSLRS